MDGVSALAWGFASISLLRMASGQPKGSILLFLRSLPFSWALVRCLGKATLPAANLASRCRMANHGLPWQDFLSEREPLQAAKAEPCIDWRLQFIFSAVCFKELPHRLFKLAGHILPDVKAAENRAEENHRIRGLGGPKFLAALRRQPLH